MSESKPKDAKTTLSIESFSLQTAPILYFDSVPICGNNKGMVSLTLCADLTAPSQSGQTIDTSPRVVAHLRCTPASARRLRDTIDRTLLLAAETQGGKN